MVPVKLLLVVALLTTSACNAYTSPKDKLQVIAQRYNENVRWQRFEAASKALPLKRRRAWVSAMEHAAQTFRIVEYEVQPIKVTDEKAIVDVFLTFYRYPAHVIERQKRRQVWRYLSKNWVIESDTERKMIKAPPPDKLPELLAPDEAEPVDPEPVAGVER